MKTLNFGHVGPGQMTNIQKKTGLWLIRKIADVLAVDGEVTIIDPREAIHSRMKHPCNDIYTDLLWRIVEAVGLGDYDWNARIPLLNFINSKGFSVWFDLGAAEDPEPADGTYVMRATPIGPLIEAFTKK